jgi:hypothetical protein
MQDAVVLLQLEASFRRRYSRFRVLMHIVFLFILP